MVVSETLFPKLLPLVFQEVAFYVLKGYLLQLER